jgi:hypothetical protein
MEKMVAVVGQDGWVQRGWVRAAGTEDERFEQTFEGNTRFRPESEVQVLEVLRRMGWEALGVPVASDGSEPEWTVDIRPVGEEVQH